MATALPVSPDVATSTWMVRLSEALRVKCPSRRAMKRAPTSLKASVGPWKSSRAPMLRVTGTTGQSNERVSSTMRCSSAWGMSSPKRASATVQAISWKVMVWMLSKKLSGRTGMRSGM